MLVKVIHPLNPELPFTAEVTDIENARKRFGTEAEIEIIENDTKPHFGFHIEK